MTRKGYYTEEIFFDRITAKLDITFDDFHEINRPGIVSPWMVRKRDVFFIGSIYKSAGCSRIADLGCGYGFLPWLLAMEGLEVAGIEASENVHYSPYRHRNLSLMHGDYQRIVKGLPYGFDGVLVSWPSQGDNPAPAVLALNPRVVIYVIETNGLCGDKKGRYLSDLMPRYMPFVYWENVNYRDVGYIFYNSVVNGDSDLADVFRSSNNRMIAFVRRDFDLNAIYNKMNRLFHIFGVGEYPWEDEMNRFYPVGAVIEREGKVLWTPLPVGDEGRFIRSMRYRGLVDTRVL